MPIYDYKCKKCSGGFKQTLTVAKRSQPTLEPCPNCGSDHSVYISVGAVTIGYSGAGRLRTTNNFNDRLKEIRKRVGKDGKDSLTNVIR